ncbi:hypothetical protein K6Y81_03955 [Burkholderia cenocepacia]|nr:hypothetical protein [Burkholderia cenocepacia]
MRWSASECAEVGDATAGLESNRRPEAAVGARLAGGPGGVQAASGWQAARGCEFAQRGEASVTGVPRAGGARVKRYA